PPCPIEGVARARQYSHLCTPCRTAAVSALTRKECPLDRTQLFCVCSRFGNCGAQAPPARSSHRHETQTPAKSLPGPAPRPAHSANEPSRSRCSEAVQIPPSTFALQLASTRAAH